MRSRFAPSLLIALVLVCRADQASGLSLQAYDDAQGVLRVDTRLVLVDVVVRDDNGPVGDLESEDFMLYADGERQEISVFEVTRAGMGDAPAPTRLPREPVVSNRPTAGNYAPTAATVILVDRLNTEVLDQPRANAELMEFVGSLAGRNVVAIYELSGQLRLIQDFTSDREVLVRAVQSMGTDFSRQLDGSYGEGVTGGFEAGPTEVGLDQDLVNARLGTSVADRGTAIIDQFVATYYVNSRIRVTAEVLEAIATHMSGLTGRKTLVWLSGRFPFSFEPRSEFGPDEIIGNVRQLEQTAHLLTDANIAVYPISAVGLLAPLFNEPGAQLYPSTANFGGRLGREPASTNTMRQIARMTGGKATYLTNGLREAMTEAAEDADVIYTLGFYPDSSSLDMDFHELRVEVDRNDLDVRHRRGYYGFGVSGSPDPSDRVPIVDLVTSPVNATAIGLTATSPLREADGAERVTRLMVDLNDLGLDFHDGAWIGAVEIATLIVAPGSEDTAVEVGTLDIALTDQEYKAAIAAGYELFSLSSIDAEPAWLRVVVREPTSGAAGSLWVPLY